MSTAKITGYRILGGIHPATASLTKLLSFHGINDPRTDKPFTEALLLGIGGGINFGYTLEDNPHKDTSTNTIHFINNSVRLDIFVESILASINVGFDVFQSKSIARADEALRETLAGGTPVMYWIDKSVLPHYANIDSYHDIWIVNIVGIEGNVLTIDDVSKCLFPVTHELIIETRKSIPGLKNRFLTLTKPKKFDLKKAVRQGIQIFIQQSESLNGGLSQQKKLISALVGSGPTSWKTCIAGKPNLYSNLERIFESSTLEAGGNLRNVYADFLKDASVILNKPKLNASAKLFKKLAKDWNTFGEIALTDVVEDFTEAKELIREKYELFYTLGPDAHKELERIDTRLKDIADKNRDWPPLTEEKTLYLFEQLAHQLEIIHTKEQYALESLKQAIK